MIKDKNFEVEAFDINKKTYLVPHHQLKGCEKYFETKVPPQQKAHRERKFYTPQELKDMEAKLTCGIHYRTNNKVETKLEKVLEERQEKEVQPQEEKKIVRPALRSQGPTHFIMVPVSKQLKEVYENMIVPTIEYETLPLDSLHVSLLGFQLKNQFQLDQWSSILKEIKKKKLTVKGMGMVGEKERYARQIHLNIQGIDDVVDTIIGKAIDRKLIQQTELTRVRFDKKSQTYKAESPCVVIVKTKGKDLVDTKDFLASFKSLTVGPIPVSEYRISIIGSYKQGEGYYNDRVVTL